MLLSLFFCCPAVLRHTMCVCVCASGNVTEKQEKTSESVEQKTAEAADGFSSRISHSGIALLSVRMQRKQSAAGSEAISPDGGRGKVSKDERECVSELHVR